MHWLQIVNMCALDPAAVFHDTLHMHIKDRFVGNISTTTQQWTLYEMTSHNFVHEDKDISGEADIQSSSTT